MANGPDDLVYGAQVVDKTGEFFDRFGKRAEETFAKASSAFAKFEQGIGGIGKELGLVAGLVGGVASKVAGLAIDKVFQMADGFQQFALDATQLRARADTLAVSLNLIGKNAGYTEEQLAGIEDGMRKTGISIIAARQSMSQWIQSNLDLSKASEVARTAQDAAVIAGLNSSETFQRITHAAITLQPELLRSLNLYVNMEDAMKRYAKEANKSVKELSAQEKQQAFLNEVLRVGAVNAGAYEAAMDTVGKKQASLQRVTEDLQVALGAVFQPAMGEIVDAQTEVYKDLTKFLEEHEEELIAFGEDVAYVFGIALDLLVKLGEQLVLFPGYIKDAGLELAQFLGQLSDEELAKRESGMGMAFKQAAAIGIGAFMTLWDAVKMIFSDIAENAKGLGDYLSGKISGSDLFKIVEGNTLPHFLDELKTKFAENTKSAAEFTGVLEKTDDDAKKVEDSTKGAAKGIDDIGDAADKAAEAMEKANESLAKLYDQMQQDAIKQQLDETRQAIEDALQEAWRLEDLARKHQEAVSNIMEGAQESRREAMEDHSETLLDIERSYQRQLRDIQQDFEYEASELSRARDAIGLLRLMRQKDRELKEAKESRDDANEDADRAYQKQLQELDERRRKALEDLADQERKEAEEHQRGLERQEELQRLHDQWEEEDRQRNYAERLADLIGNFNDMDGITDDGLKSLFDRWSLYFGDLLQMAQERYEEMQQYLNPETTDPNYTGHGTSGNPGGGSPTGSSVYGQGGQVSQLLANPSMLQPTMTVSRLPPVSPSRSSDRRQIDVSVTGETLDPYMQRVVANALLEIERNRGS